MGEDRLCPAEQALADLVAPAPIGTHAIDERVNDPGRDPDRSFAALCRFHLACHRQATCTASLPVTITATVLLKAPSVIRDAARARRLLRINIGCLPRLSSMPGGIAVAGSIYREASEASSG
jgi:hypothetical protein